MVIGQLLINLAADWLRIPHVNCPFSTHQLGFSDGILGFSLKSLQECSRIKKSAFPQQQLISFLYHYFSVECRASGELSVSVSDSILHPLTQFIHHKGRGLFIILLHNLIKFHKNLSGLSFSAPLRHKSTQNDIMLSQRHSLATNKGKMEQRNKELACTRSNQG